jgi:hypothetical protein
MTENATQPPFRIWRSEGRVRIDSFAGSIELSEADAGALADDLRPVGHQTTRIIWSPENQEALRQAYVVERKTPKEIAREWRCKPRQISRFIIYCRLPAHRTAVSVAAKKTLKARWAAARQFA